MLECNVWQIHQKSSPQVVFHLPSYYVVTIAGDGTASSILSSTTPSSLSQSTQSSNFPSSNSAADSLGVMIQVSVKTIRVRLELGCGGGVEDVFGTGGGKSGANFSRIYQEYTTQVAHLDANICSYLKVKDMGQRRAK